MARPVLIGASYYGELRAKDGVNFGAVALLVGDNPTNISQAANMSFASFGPGATADVPGTRFYWAALGGLLKYTNGAVSAAVPGAPGVVNRYFQLYYDRPNDRLYATYEDGVSFPGAGYYTVAGWTLLPATGALGDTSGVITVIPAGSGLRPNRAIIGVDGVGDTVQVVRSFDGAVWQTELSQHVTNIPFALVPYGTQVLFCSSATRAVPNAADPILQLRANNGTWTDITNPSWAEANRRRATCAVVAGDDATADIYVAYQRLDNTRVEIWKRTAAGGWSLDLNLITEGSAPAMFPWSLSYIDGVLYIGMDDATVLNYYLAKDVAGGGAWTRHNLPTNLQPPFVESSIQFFIESPEATITPNSGNCSGESGEQVVICGYWDAEPFEAWGGAPVWTLSHGLWSVVGGAPQGARAWLNAGVVEGTRFGSGTDGQVGEIDVVDPFILTGRTPNGRGFVNLQVQNPDIFDPAALPLFIDDGYQFVCPAITSVDPPAGDIDGGYVVTLHGTNFFDNLRPASAYINDLRDYNLIEIIVGTKVILIDPQLVVFVDTETLTFVMTSYPGGISPDAEIDFQPAGLDPLTGGSTTPSYRCPVVTAAFTFTGLGDFAIIGSLETVLGLGGTGGDVRGPADSGDGGGGIGGATGPALCPTDVAAGPCIR